MPSQYPTPTLRPGFLLARGTTRLHGTVKALVVVFLLLLARTGMSQTTAGSISGTVVDPQQAVVPKATVSVGTGAGDGANGCRANRRLFPIDRSER
jgi:hypothetical protein